MRNILRKEMRLIVLSDEIGIALIPDEAFMSKVKKTLEEMKR